MNNGAFGEGFPYTNFHDLNMDWIVKIAKDFLDQYNNIQQIITEGEYNLHQITETGLDQLKEKTVDLERTLQAWYDEHSEDIANQLVQALADLNKWYTTHTGYLDQYLADSVASFNQQAEQKAQQTIATIPSDYTSLSNKVSSLNGSYFEECNWIPITVDIPSNYINGNVTDNGTFYPNVKYAIQTVRAPLIKDGYFKVGHVADGYYMYAVGFKNLGEHGAGYGFRIRTQQGSDTFTTGDISVPVPGVKEVYFVFAHNPVGADIAPADISTIQPVVYVNSDKQFSNIKTHSYSRKGAKLLPTANTWNDIVSESGTGVIENIFFAGNFAVNKLQIRVTVDDDIISLDGYLYELIGLLTDNTTPVTYGTEYFGKTGRQNGIYLNYKIPYYKNFKISIRCTDTTNPYVWFTVKSSDWHPITIANFTLPFGAYFYAIRRTQKPIAPGTYLDLYTSDKNGLILGTIMAAKGYQSSWFMEGMIRAYIGSSSDPELICSGLEDYFYGTYYFETGTYYYDIAGCTYIDNDEHLFSAYRLHTHDLITHESGGYKWTLRNGDIATEDESEIQNPTYTEYNWYILNYQW